MDRLTTDVSYYTNDIYQIQTNDRISEGGRYEL